MRLHPSVKTLILDAENKHLIEMVLLSTHNICFDLERRRLFFNHTYQALVMCMNLQLGQNCHPDLTVKAYT